VSNWRIIPRNLIDEAATAAASPSLLSTHPLSRVQQQGRATARTTGLTTQVFTFTWSSNQTANAAVVALHNLRTAGTIRIEVFSDAALTVSLEDSTALAAFSTTGLSQLDVDDYLTSRLRGMKNFVFWFSATRTTIRGLRITFTDAANADGFMEVARFVMGKYFEATYNPPYAGEGLTLATLTGQVRADGGTLYSDRRADYRIERLQLDSIPDATDLAELKAIAGYLGKHKDFFFTFYPGVGGVKEVYHQGIFKFTELGALEPHFVNLHRQSIVMEEA